MAAVSLSALMDYIVCPMLYWWRYRARVRPPVLSERLPEMAVRGGLFYYYHGYAETVWDGCMRAWERLTRGVSGDDLPERVRNLQVSRLTGYTPMQAFEDSLQMARKYNGPKRGEGLKYRCPFYLDARIIGRPVRGVADLVYHTAGEPEETVVEIHDFGPLWSSAVSCRLDVMGVANAEDWREPVILYRHIPTGVLLPVHVEAGRSVRLAEILLAAMHGIRNGVIIPRISVSEEECIRHRCPYYGLCAPGGSDTDILDTASLFLLGGQTK